MSVSHSREKPELRGSTFHEGVIGAEILLARSTSCHQPVLCHSLHLILSSTTNNNCFYGPLIQDNPGALTKERLTGTTTGFL